MSITTRLPLVLALALGATYATGCASNPTMPGTGGGDDVGGGGDDGGGGGDDGGGGSNDPTPLDASGSYKMQSTFDIASNMPGKVGIVVNTIIDATDGADDPSDWLLNLMIDQMSPGTLKTILQNAEPFVAGTLNDELLSIAPDFVTTMLQLGNDFGDMAKHVGLNETLDVTHANADYTAKRTVYGAHFVVNGSGTDVLFGDHDVQNVVVNGIGMTVDLTGKVSIADHALPLSYGAILHLGVDGAIIPLLDPSATNLVELFNDKVDCAAVGSAVASAVGFGSASAYETACHSALTAGANAIYGRIDDIDSSLLTFQINGTAKIVDTNNDHKGDKLQTGKWMGTLTYAAAPAPLGDATFFGQRQ